MNQVVKIAFVVVLSLVSFVGISQTTDSQLAAHYYQNEEYGKALLYYNRLYSKQSNTSNYNYLFKCLIKLENYSEARKLSKRHVRIDPINQKAKVDYGYTYGLEGNVKMRSKEFKKLVKTLAPNYQVINELAAAFLDIKRNQEALDVYQQGRSVMKNTYPFNTEIADIYYRMERYDDMTEELLNLLELNSGYLKTVEGLLNKTAANEKDSPANKSLKKGLIQKINQKPNSTVFSEMLIWVYMQEANWNAAFIQVKALDRRLGEDGRRVYNLAETLANNKEYKVAADAYAYVVKVGKKSQYYVESRIGGLMVRFNQLAGGGSIDSLAMTELITDFDATINILGKNEGTATLLRKKAFVQCFYQHKLEEGLDTYEEALSINGIDPHQLAEIKLEYGDALLAGGYIWDASLVYGQVDKGFKYDFLGEKAKFKSSKVHFYTGNFDLAKAQLDILKGATTKLIANDAMLLSVIISDNSTVDTTTAPLKLYADADLLIFQNRLAEARAKLDSIKAIYPGHALEDEMLMLRYEMAMSEKNYEAGAGFLEDIKALYPTDILADKAIYRLAELFEEKLEQPTKAKELYQLIITDYQDSLFATESRKRFRRLRGDNL